MNKQKILDELTKILRDLLLDDSIDLSMSTVRAEVPGWDSFAYISFMVAVESGYGIKFGVAEIESFQTVGEIVARGVPEALLVCVGDLPGLRAEHVRPLVARFAAEADPACICLPTHAGRDGHPVLFGAGHFAALAALTGDRGGRGIVEGNPEGVCRIEMDTPAVLRDVDTPADLEAIRD